MRYPKLKSTCETIRNIYEKRYLPGQVEDQTSKVAFISTLYYTCF